MTAQTVRHKSRRCHGAEFSLTHVRPEKIFGTASVWRGRTRVPVADVHRTILDMLADPELGGGIQHVADCLSVYLKSDRRDDDLLIRYAVRLGPTAPSSSGWAFSPNAIRRARNCWNPAAGG